MILVSSCENVFNICECVCRLLMTIAIKLGKWLQGCWTGLKGLLLQRLVFSVHSLKKQKVLFHLIRGDIYYFPCFLTFFCVCNEENIINLFMHYVFKVLNVSEFEILFAFGTLDQWIETSNLSWELILACWCCWLSVSNWSFVYKLSERLCSKSFIF